MAEKEYIERAETCKGCLYNEMCDLSYDGEICGHFKSNADVVEVVRCKDCSYWQRNTGIADSPNGQCFYHDICTNGFGFCNYGAKMDGGKPDEKL